MSTAPSTAPPFEPSSAAELPDEDVIAHRWGELQQDLRMALTLNNHIYDPVAIPLFTIQQLVSAVKAPALHLIGEHVRLQRKLLQGELAQELSRIPPNPQVAANTSRVSLTRRYQYRRSMTCRGQRSRRSSLTR